MTLWQRYYYNREGKLLTQGYSAKEWWTNTLHSELSRGPRFILSHDPALPSSGHSQNRCPIDWKGNIRSILNQTKQGIRELQ